MQNKIFRMISNAQTIQWLPKYAKDLEEKCYIN